MPVINSTYQVGLALANGSRLVQETHTLNVGDPIIINYRAAVGTDYAAKMTARVARLNEQLAESEFALQLDRSGINLNHQTASEFAARLRERWRRSSQEQCARIAWWIIKRLNAGDVTDTQLRNAFGLTLTQWNALKTSKLIPMHDSWAVVLAAAGE